MKLYIIERNDSIHIVDPEIFTDGNKAVKIVKKEYYERAAELEISPEVVEDGGDNHHDCNWDIDEDDFAGECVIDDLYYDNRWKWRITKHELNDAISKGKLVECFRDMAKRGTLLTGSGVTQDDILKQIVGAIMKVDMEN